MPDQEARSALIPDFDDAFGREAGDGEGIADQDGARFHFANRLLHQRRHGLGREKGINQILGGKILGPEISADQADIGEAREAQPQPGEGEGQGRGFDPPEPTLGSAPGEKQQRSADAAAEIEKPETRRRGKQSGNRLPGPPVGQVKRNPIPGAVPENKQKNNEYN